MKKRFALLSFAATFAFAMVSLGNLAQAQQDSSPSAQPPSQSQQAPPDAQAPAPQTPDTQAPASQQQSPDTQAPPAQQPSTQAPAQQPQDQAQTSDANGTKEFIGTVSKQGSKYVFQDAATGTTYDIDHQDEVAKFDGKKVRVHGTLDSTGKMIHVQ